MHGTLSELDEKGLSVQDAVKNGTITADDAAALNQIKGKCDGGAAGRSNPSNPNPYHRE